MPLPEVSTSSLAALPVSAPRAVASVERRPGLQRYSGGHHPALASISRGEAPAEAPEALVEQAGFFIVSDRTADRYLRRAAEEEFFDRSGYGLPDVTDEEAPKRSPLSLSGAEATEIAGEVLRAAAAARGSSVARLIARATGIPVSARPSSNSSASGATARSAIVAFDRGGRESVLDVYLSKTTEDRFELVGFDRAEAAPGGGFPYAAGPHFMEQLRYDAATGSMVLVSGALRSLAAPSPAVTSLTFLKERPAFWLTGAAVSAALLLYLIGLAR